MTGSSSFHHPGSVAPHDPDDLYAFPPPWDIGRPQSAFLALAAEGTVWDRVLAAGCGTGGHVLMSAGLGLDATGVGLATRAPHAARAKARDWGLAAQFVRQDARHLAGPGETFGTVLDCGLFHVFTDAERLACAAGLWAVLEPGGRYFMLCFSDRQPGEWGRVQKVTRDEITATFAGGWRVDSVEAAIITDPGGIRAWLAALTRI
jgi:SAM-dependent methyltransferase